MYFLCRYKCTFKFLFFWPNDVLLVIPQTVYKQLLINFMIDFQKIENFNTDIIVTSYLLNERKSATLSIIPEVCINFVNVYVMTAYFLYQILM